MTTTSISAIGQAELTELRSAVRGDVVGPHDLEYTKARTVWNAMFDRRPGAIVRARGVADVIATVRLANRIGALLAVRGGGHSFAGLSTCDGGIVLDLSRMRGVRVDPLTSTVNAQAGLTWAGLDHETQAFGLATTGGLVSTTGIAGFTLGGGIGWLMRRHGLAVDNLIAADVVTADGELRRASTHDNPDLLWGLRGGGGNFGAVTSLEYQLHPVGPIVLGGAIFHLVERARDLLHFYRTWATTLPDELTTMIAFLSAPPLPFIPADLVGAPMIGVAACHVGDLHAGTQALAALRAFAPPVADVIGPIPYLAMQQMFDTSAPPGLRNYTKTSYADHLDDATIEALLLQTARLTDLYPLSAVHVHHLGGAIQRAEEHDTAFDHRDHPFLFNIISTWADPGADAVQRAWAKETADALAPHLPTAQYTNFLADAGQDKVRAAYGESTYARLAILKRRYDPTNLFRLNLNIDPTSG